MVRPGGRGALRGTFKQRRSRLLAPRQGGGVRCAAMFGCRVRPFTRCAASLRMTPWVTGARDEKQNAVFVRTVKRRISQENKMPSLPEKQSAVSFRLTVLYFTPNIYGTAPLSPTCHPERSGTTRQESSAPTNHCRTANPAPSGAPAGGISIAKRHHTPPRTALYPRSRWARCGEYPQKTRGAGGK